MNEFYQPAPGAHAYPLVIGEMLKTPLANSPGQEIVSGGRRFSYRELGHRVTALAGALRRMGVGEGDVVAVMDWDNHRYLECFFAVPMLGAILHSVNVRLSPEQVLYTINHARDDVIIVNAEFLPLLGPILPRVEKPARLILARDEEHDPRVAEDFPGSFEAEYEDLAAQPHAGFEFPDLDENTLATTFYTTGTTGDPKGVAYTHRQLVLHTLGIIAGVATAAGNNRFHRGDVYMPITPMFHVHGWGMPYAATLLGLRQVYPGRYEPSELLRLIAEEGVTFSHCVPTILGMLLEAPESRATDLSRFKVIIGGAALPQGLAKAARDRGIEVFAGYGLSETCPILTTPDLTVPAGEPGSDEDLAQRRTPGKPVPLVQVRVVDEHMNDLPRGGHVTGEIVVRAPWLTACYTRDPGAGEQLWRGGYLHTGDAGYLDESGSLHITDRIKDVIKSGGEWISSLDLENIVSRCPGVAEVAVIGIPDDKWGERPMVIVVRSEGADIDAEAVRRAVMQRAEAGELPAWAVPERVEFVAGIDRTSVGKQDKKKLRTRWSQRLPD